MENERDKQITEKKTGIDNLRKELNLLNDQKEQWFARKEGLNAKIASLIEEIKKNKALRDECSQTVKEEKQKRDVLHAKLKEKSEAIKPILKDVDALSPVANPLHIKQEIDKLEHAVETNVMSFEKEKQIMKRINELKKEYKESEKTKALFDQRSNLRKEISTSRTEANKAHRIVQAKAKESQEKHELILSLSKQIDDLRKEEQDAFAKFLELKIKFAEVNEKLKDELAGLHQLSGQQEQEKAEKRAQKQHSTEKELEKKEEVVEEKIKARKTLTMDDLLVYQKQLEQEEKRKD